MDRNLPSGTVTFLLTDIEQSTRLVQALGDVYAVVLADQRTILRAAFEHWSGTEIDTQGDSFFVAFPRARDAVQAAVEAQQVLAAHLWPSGASVRVRMGLHTGEPHQDASGYTGLDLHRAARICAAGHGGQVLLSQTTRDLVAGHLPAGQDLRDLGKHRLKDLSRPEAIFQLTGPALAADFPPLKTLADYPHNLPAATTSFVGRDHDLSEVKALLAANRLVTLTGSGGVGKTRLALQVAAGQMGIFKDGVWLVELAPLTDPALVADAVALVFGVHAEQGRSLESTLADWLSRKEVLILLDNCEHLVEACAQLAEAALRASRGLRLLATSREALGVAGEAAWHVPSLSLPDPKQIATPERVAQSAAVRLFIERATLAQPSFRLTAANAAAVAQICSRLDGIPLALELAAARVKVLHVAQIAERLDDRFRLLTGGSRTALPRQQTLRSLIDWSYGLLTGPEQLLLRRLSVFAGGWTLEAAEALSAGDGGSADSLDVLTRLVDKSLVVVDEQAHAVRYRMLETIRQYAEAKLAEAGEAPEVWARALAYFCQLAEQAEPQLLGLDAQVWLNRLELERDNLRAVQEHSAPDAPTAALGLRLMGALLWYWERRGDYDEGRTRVSAALARAAGQEQSLPYAKALVALAHMTFRQGDYATAKAQAEASLAAFRASTDRSGLVFLLMVLGNVNSELGDYEAALAFYTEGLALSLELNDKWGASMGLINLAYADMRLGDYASARARFTQSLGFTRETGDRFSGAYALFGLGEVAVRQGEYAEATRLLEESLSFCEQDGNKRGIGVSLGTLGWLAMRQADWPLAKARLGGSLRVRQEIGDKGGIAWCLERLAEVAEALGQPQSAVRVYGAAAALRASIDSIIDPVDQPAYEQRLATLRAALGEARYNAAWSGGQSDDEDAAVASALA